MAPALQAYPLGSLECRVIGHHWVERNARITGTSRDPVLGHKVVWVEHELHCMRPGGCKGIRWKVTANGEPSGNSYLYPRGYLLGDLRKTLSAAEVTRRVRQEYLRRVLAKGKEKK